MDSSPEQQGQQPQPSTSSGIREESAINAWNAACTNRLQTLAESIDPTELIASHTNVGVYQALLNKMHLTKDAESVAAAAKLLGPMLPKQEGEEAEKPEGADDEPDIDEDVVGDHGADGDEAEAGNERQKTGAASRHSENKKEYLKVIETTVSRLMNERDELDDIIKKMMEAEKKVTQESDMYMEMIKYVDSIACDDMSPREWEEFFEKHFVQGVFKVGDYRYPVSDQLYLEEAPGEEEEAPKAAKTGDQATQPSPSVDDEGKENLIGDLTLD
ncbi:uncharacterized protein LOC110849508 isoform X2 [Folsomia candida]|uniref:uncharacterized protein LOC110849508 isoform X2 n=1 Tax=Folsomia candida TaxID=158441 RepID=UPI000B8FB2B5|nr:uncharacterized protein LOC110849508 isoform X2 [Folsomia candida]